ncbi:MAG: N-acetyltransferase [Cytophagales bacterium]|nr:MAG: N-acetyltransferase [Cytophagales bacterium]TAF62071.1 MAG: N-acetyltransferase [Cytophagales bacterium]
MFIQKADIEHIPIIRQIAQNTWPDTFGAILSPTQIEYMLQMMYSEDALKQQIQTLGHTFLLTGYAQSYTGYVSYEISMAQIAETKIHKLYVLPTEQGKKYGLKLMQAVEEAALQQQQTSLLLNVNRYNKAIKFYQNYGFKIIKTEDIAIGNGFLMEDYVMRKSLIDKP